MPGELPPPSVRPAPSGPHGRLLPGRRSSPAPPSVPGPRRCAAVRRHLPELAGPGKNRCQVPSGTPPAGAPSAPHHAAEKTLPDGSLTNQLSMGPPVGSNDAFPWCTAHTLYVEPGRPKRRPSSLYGPPPTHVNDLHSLEPKSGSGRAEHLVSGGHPCRSFCEATAIVGQPTRHRGFRGKMRLDGGGLECYPPCRGPGAGSSSSQRVTEKPPWDPQDNGPITIIDDPGAPTVSTPPTPLSVSRRQDHAPEGHHPTSR